MEWRRNQARACPSPQAKVNLTSNAKAQHRRALEHNLAKSLVSSRPIPARGCLVWASGRGAFQSQAQTAGGYSPRPFGRHAHAVAIFPTLPSTPGQRRKRPSINRRAAFFVVCRLCLRHNLPMQYDCMPREEMLKGAARFSVRPKGSGRPFGSCFAPRPHGAARLFMSCFLRFRVCLLMRLD